MMAAEGRPIQADSAAPKSVMTWSEGQRPLGITSDSMYDLISRNFLKLMRFQYG